MIDNFICISEDFITDGIIKEINQFSIVDKDNKDLKTKITDGIEKNVNNFVANPTIKYFTNQTDLNAVFILQKENGLFINDFFGTLILRETSEVLKKNISMYISYMCKIYLLEKTTKLI